MEQFIFDLTPFLKIGFYLTLIFYVIFSVIVIYHWENYATSRVATLQTYIAYGLVTLPLLLIMAIIAF